MLTLFLFTVFPLLVIGAAVSDLFTMTIPNPISFLLVAGFLAAALLTGLTGQEIVLQLGCAMAVLVIGFTFFALGWIGGGDAKLAAAITLWLSLGSLLDYAMLAAVYGGILTIAILSLRTLPLPAFALGWSWLTRLHDRKTGVPYGIALAAAALTVFPTTPLWRAAL